MANPSTASPTLKVIKININLVEFITWDKFLIIKILLNDSISKIKSKLIK
jgi:hypothetical protein